MDQLPIDQLSAHPLNPRTHCEKFTKELASSITDEGFGEEHAILVRPFEDGFQIISGHTRVSAANLAGQIMVPVIIREMDDAEAYMQLLLQNKQRELSNVDKAMHVFNCVELSEGGAGNKGGISEYARRSGMDRSTVQFFGKAGAVLSEMKGATCVAGFPDDKIRHLAEIEKQPRENWGALVELLIDQDWSLAKLKQYLEPKEDEVKEEPETEEESIPRKGTEAQIETPPDEVGPIVKALKTLDAETKISVLCKSLSKADRKSLYLGLCEEFGDGA